KRLPTLYRIGQAGEMLGLDTRSRIMRSKGFEGWLVAGFMALWIGATWAGSARADDWPQWLGPKRDGVWRETGIVDKFPEGGPKVRWRQKIGPGYTGPAVAQGRVYVMDRELAPDAKKPANDFARGNIPGKERIICLNEAD